ncbi:MAG: hypothetical protein CVV42_17300 [Candidatus Riflebacteria bacterium HGW-Riflebacteria-2]|jgi:HTH-type transcriptional regulator/antitoxin HigA|nr:MAG: hypothetical protein CVV42_17300 [Candidatus Riflebacteria bacterium HGW-Riflebacteria-2]
MKLSEKNNLEIDDFEVFDSTFNDNDGISLLGSYKAFNEVWNRLPKRVLAENEWIKNPQDKASILWLWQEMLSTNQQALFRKASDETSFLGMVWLAKVSFLAKNSLLKSPLMKFNSLTVNDLQQIARLSISVDSIKQLPTILAKKGIILIYEKALPSAKIDAAVFKLETGNPVIGLSIRYSRLDYFWFTIMHELSHIVLHLNKLNVPITEDVGDFDHKRIDKNEIELAADNLASRTLIPRHLLRNISLRGIDEELVNSISAFAEVHPIIAAGMIRRYLNNYKLFPRLMYGVDVRELIVEKD